MAIEKQALVDSFEMNGREVIKVHVQEREGKRYVDLRAWLLDEPANNGLTLHVELLPRLIQALQKADELLRQPAVYQLGRSQLGRSRLG